MNKDRPRRQKAPFRGTPNERPQPPAWVHLYGLHAVSAALQNPERQPSLLYFDQKKEDALRPVLEPILEQHNNPPPLQATSAQFMGSLVPDGAPHQGVVLKTRPLENASFKAVCDRLFDEPGLVVVLDQVTDPQNVGAIIRSAVAFNAQAIVTTDRNAPFETGSLSRAAGYDLGSDYHIQKFFAEVFGGRFGHPVDFESLPADIHTRFDEILDQNIAVLIPKVLSNKKTFGRTTNSCAPCLRIQDNAASLLKISRAIDVDVTNTF